MADLDNSPSSRSSPVVYPLTGGGLLASQRGVLSRAVPWALAAIAIAVLIALALIKSIVLRVLLPLVIATVAIGMLLRRGRRRRARSAERVLALSMQRIDLIREGRRVTLADLGERFGVTLLSNKRGSRMIAAVTSRAGAFLVGTTLGEEHRKTLSRRLCRAHVIANDENALSAIGPDGTPIVLGPTDFVDLLDRLEQREPECTMRMILSDATGSPLWLDRRALRVKNFAFDLTRPLEWEPLLFQESLGDAVARYQGTRVKQGSEEVVLVSLLSPGWSDPSLEQESAGMREVECLPELDLAANRDQRLMRASPQAPPPPAVRVGVDALFMLPLRDALDRAPRMTAPPERRSHA